MFRLGENARRVYFRNDGHFKRQNGTRSVEALTDRAVDGETRAPEGFTTWPGDQTVPHEGENLELFTHLSPEPLVDSILGPFEQLRIPVRAVIERDCGNSPDHVIRSESIGQICRQTLPQWIVATDRLGSLGADEDTLDGTTEAVIVTQQDFLH